ncbi:MAG: Smr/MutS family protein [Bacteroidales bacterium]|nr:Smr/MutS family protein [Bacteroidales bacterium]
MDLRLETKLGFDRVREAVMRRCATEYASERVQAEEFCTDASRIRQRQLLCDEMRLILMFEDSFPSAGYIDAIPFLEPIGNRHASIDLLSLGKLRTLLETLRKVMNFLRGVKEGVYPNLQHMFSGAAMPMEVVRRIDTILDRTGEMKDTASDQLYSIRRSIRDKEINVSKRMNGILRQAQATGLADPDASVSIREGKMLIPVLSARKRQLPGFVFDESATGKTSYIQPAEIIELENELSQLRFAESREVARILSEFADFLRPYVPELLEDARLTGELDFIMAKAYVALEYIAGMPIISEDGSLSLRKARHPLLEKSLRKEGKSIVPLSLELTPQKRILLISGPNAGGKSVCLKTVGLLQYMFQWGMPIPTSEVSELPVFDRIMLSIGDDQSLENDLSTYSSFLSDMKEMLSKADFRTLILIDEFGSGTEPAAGGAIAEAILHELDGRLCYGVITTHYTNLKLYASAADTGVINGAMQFDTATVSPLFVLETGLPGSSFAFELARKMGLPEAIVHDAEQRAGQEYVGIERNLRKIARSRRALDEKLSRVKAADRTLEGLTDRYEKELEQVKSLRTKVLDEARTEAEKIVKDANRQVENTIRTIRESQADKAQTREARSQLQGFLGALADSRRSRDAYIEGKLKTVKEQKARGKSLRRARGEQLPEAEPAASALSASPLKVGEKVRVSGSTMVGEVAKVSNKAVTVIIGQISSKLPLDRVQRISANEFKAAAPRASERPRAVYDSSIQERKARFKPEIDVRGERVNDAMETVVRFLDDALMLGVGTVRILHGKGTGALREEIQKYARTVPGVLSASDEDVRLGGSGVTVIKLG